MYRDNITRSFLQQEIQHYKNCELDEDREECLERLRQLKNAYLQGGAIPKFDFLLPDEINFKENVQKFVEFMTERNPSQQKKEVLGKEGDPSHMGNRREFITFRAYLLLIDSTDRNTKKLLRVVEDAFRVPETWNQQLYILMVIQKLRNYRDEEKDLKEMINVFLTSRPLYAYSTTTNEEIQNKIDNIRRFPINMVPQEQAALALVPRGPHGSVIPRAALVPSNAPDNNLTPEQRNQLQNGINILNNAVNSPQIQQTILPNDRLLFENNPQEYFRQLKQRVEKILNRTQVFVAENAEETLKAVMATIVIVILGFLFRKYSLFASENPLLAFGFFLSTLATLGFSKTVTQIFGREILRVANQTAQENANPEFKQDIQEKVQPVQNLLENIQEYQSAVPPVEQARFLVEPTAPPFEEEPTVIPTAPPLEEEPRIVPTAPPLEERVPKMTSAQQMMAFAREQERQQVSQQQVPRLIQQPVPRQQVPRQQQVPRLQQPIQQQVPRQQPIQRQQVLQPNVGRMTVQEMMALARQQEQRK